jgi:hypothetical protein
MPRPSAKLLATIRSACVNSEIIESSSQREVSQILTELGLQIEDEVSPSSKLEFLDSLLAVDMTCAKHTVAIEFDGPSHYLRSVKSGKLTRSENGPTQTKRRFIEKLGWKMMKIDYRDWAKAGGSKQAKLKFLRNELAKVGVQV